MRGFKVKNPFELSPYEIKRIYCMYVLKLSNFWGTA
jgi:hypothetical protein